MRNQMYVCSPIVINIQIQCSKIYVWMYIHMNIGMCIYECSCIKRRHIGKDVCVSQKLFTI